MCGAIFKHGVDYTIVQRIRATLEGRLAAATLSGNSKGVAVSRGCPQGGVLSPLLWCLVDDLITRLNGGGIYTHGYADDIFLLAVEKLPDAVSGLIQWALRTVEMWCDVVGLLVHPDQPGLVVFTRRRKLPRFTEQHFFCGGGVTLCRPVSFKYLWVVLDSRLTWIEHMDVKVRKAQNLLWSCRRVCGSTWALRPKVVHWLGFSIIRPSISFASLVWWPGCPTVNAKKRLSRVQRSACLGIYGSDAHYSYGVLISP
jgi:hypothetical protein